MFHLIPKVVLEFHVLKYGVMIIKGKCVVWLHHISVSQEVVDLVVLMMNLVGVLRLERMFVLIVVIQELVEV